MTKVSGDERTTTLEAEVAALWELKEEYFGLEAKEKEAVVKEGMARALEKIGILVTNVGVGGHEERARLAYLKGRTLDAAEGYSAAAEEALSRAVKLAPEAVEAWNALGHVFWKKGDLRAAADCFESANGVKKNDGAYRALSMVVRAAAPQSMPAKHAAVDHARKAVELDLSKPENWYSLGNAYVARYFAKDEHARLASDLRDATKAYARAEQLYQAKFNAEEEKKARFSDLVPFTLTLKRGNPDLFFNRGHLRKYLEAYELAGADFKLAHSLDPALKANEMADGAFRWTRRVADLVKKKAGLRPKRRSEIVAKLHALARCPHRVIPLSDLPLLTDPLAGFLTDSASSSSENKDPALVATVVVLELRRDTPDVFLAAVHDPNKPDDPDFLPLSLYDADARALAPGAGLLLKAPTRFPLPDPDHPHHPLDALRVVHASNCILEGHTPLLPSFQAVSDNKMLG